MRCGGTHKKRTHTYIYKYHTQIFTKISGSIISRCDIINTMALLFSYYDIFFIYFYSIPIV